MPRTIKRELYERLLQGFREFPGNYTAAAEFAGTTPARARTGWIKGWPSSGTWAQPIKTTLERELSDARLVAAKKREEEQQQVIADAEAARRAAVEAKAQEENLIRAGRASVMQFLGIALELTPAMRKMAKEVAVKALDGTLQQSPAETFQYLSRFSQLISRGLLAADLAIKLSRLDRGQPTAIVDAGMNWTPEEAEREIEEAQAALERARARGILPAKGQVIEHVPVHQKRKYEPLEAGEVVLEEGDEA